MLHPNLIYIFLFLAKQSCIQNQNSENHASELDTSGQHFIIASYTKNFYQPQGLYQYSVLNSMYRSGLVDTLVTHTNTNGVLPNLFRRPPWLYASSVKNETKLLPSHFSILFQKKMFRWKVCKRGLAQNNSFYPSTRSNLITSEGK